MRGVAGRGLVLVGTDTAVGKTTVAAAILRLAKRKRFRLVPYKPVETGCSVVPTDAQRLCEATALPDLLPSDVCPYAFHQPLAPSVAAHLVGAPISPKDLLARGQALARRGDALLIESAGGLLTPYGGGFTSASLGELFAMPLLLIAANRLGTINHTALALSEIARRPLHLAGLLLVDVNATPAADQEFNASEIADLTGVSPLGTLRHCPTRNPDDLADALASDVDLRGIFDGALV